MRAKQDPEQEPMQKKPKTAMTMTVEINTVVSNHLYLVLKKRLFLGPKIIGVYRSFKRAFAVNEHESGIIIEIVPVEDFVEGDRPFYRCSEDEALKEVINRINKF